MVVKLGQKQRPDSVVGRLLDCHDRIRGFVELTARLGSTEEAPDDEVRSAARDVRRYFVEALPLHVEDEERSLLPRLTGRAADLDDALARMHREHAQHDPIIASLIAACEILEGTPRADVRSRLIELGAELEKELGAHLAVEEAVIFPAIERLLSKPEQDAIIGEMKMRRASKGPRAPSE